MSNVIRLDWQKGTVKEDVADIPNKLLEGEKNN